MFRKRLRNRFPPFDLISEYCGGLRTMEIYRASAHGKIPILALWLAALPPLAFVQCRTTRQTSSENTTFDKTRDEYSTQRGD